MTESRPAALESGEITRRVRAMLDRLKRDAAARRTAIDAARQAFPAFLDEVAAPVCRQVAGVLRAEGHLFSVHTPASGLRMALERSANDFVDLELDTAATPPAVLGRISYSRGQRVIVRERPVAEGKALAALTAEDVLAFLLDELAPLVESRRS
jgi:hypothetical protein